MRNQGKDVVLVSSGAIAVGRKILGLKEKPVEISKKQACASIGQASLMTVYQKLFSEYHQVTSQVLITKNVMINDLSRRNARNTFEELLNYGVIPVVNENDTISTYEIEFGEFGDNDHLSAIVAALIGADLLILLSDIDGLYTADPHKDENAELISVVKEITPEIEGLGGKSGTSLGTGGMATKLSAAKRCIMRGTDVIIANGSSPSVLYKILDGEKVGTRFISKK